jgi:hypothetical protein
MSEDTAHPPALSAPRFLDLGALLPADLAAGPAVLAADGSAVPDNQPTPTLPPLDYLLLADRLGELYEMVFPKEEEWLAEEVGAWREDMDVAQAIGRFLRRVGKLFPVHDEVWEDELEAMEWRLYNIPLTLLGFDIWHECWLEWPEPARYLIYLMAGRAVDEEEGTITRPIIRIWRFRPIWNRTGWRSDCGRYAPSRGECRSHWRVCRT